MRQFSWQITPGHRSDLCCTSWACSAPESDTRTWAVMDGRATIIQQAAAVSVSLSLSLSLLSPSRQPFANRIIPPRSPSFDLSQTMNERRGAASLGLLWPFESLVEECVRAPFKGRKRATATMQTRQLDRRAGRSTLMLVHGQKETRERFL